MELEKNPLLRCSTLTLTVGQIIVSGGGGGGYGGGGSGRGARRSSITIAQSGITTRGVCARASAMCGWQALVVRVVPTWRRRRWRGDPNSNNATSDEARFNRATYSHEGEVSVCIRQTGSIICLCRIALCRVRLTPKRKL